VMLPDTTLVLMYSNCLSIRNNASRLRIWKFQIANLTDLVILKKCDLPTLTIFLPAALGFGGSRMGVSYAAERGGPFRHSSVSRVE
jgi:hypothetical protein